MLLSGIKTNIIERSFEIPLDDVESAILVHGALRRLAEEERDQGLGKEEQQVLQELVSTSLAIMHTAVRRARPGRAINDRPAGVDFEDDLVSKGIDEPPVIDPRQHDLTYNRIFGGTEGQIIHRALKHRVRSSDEPTRQQVQLYRQRYEDSLWYGWTVHPYPTPIAVYAEPQSNVRTVTQPSPGSSEANIPQQRPEVEMGTAPVLYLVKSTTEAA